MVSHDEYTMYTRKECASWNSAVVFYEYLLCSECLYPTKIENVETSSLLLEVLGDGAFGRWLRTEGRALKWYYCPYFKKGLREFPGPFDHMTTFQKGTIYKIRKWAFTRHQIGQHFNLGGPRLHNREKKICCIYSVLRYFYSSQNGLRQYQLNQGEWQIFQIFNIFASFVMVYFSNYWERVVLKSLQL